MNDEPESARPVWKHTITEDQARWLLAGFVTKITHHRKMTSEDTSEDWIELHKEKDKRRFPSSFLNTNGYFEFSPNWCELITPTYRGNDMRNDLAAIDKWEAKNKRDRSEFERLKKKFGGKE